MRSAVVTVTELLLPPQYSAPSPAWALPVTLNPSIPEGTTTVLSCSTLMPSLALPAGADEEGCQNTGFPSTALKPRPSPR